MTSFPDPDGMTTAARASWNDEALVRDLPLVLLRVDREGLLTSLSPSWEGLSGHSIAESIGRPYQSFVAEEDRAPCRAVEGYLYAGGASPGAGTLRLQRRDGSLRVVEVRMFVLRGADGEAVGLGGVVVDVTDRRAAPRQQVEVLRLSAERTRLLIERAAFGVFGMTTGGRLLEANSALAAMLGYPDAAALLASPAVELLRPHATLRDRCVAELTEGAPESTFDVHSRRRDGTTVHLRLTMTAARDAAGRVRFLQGMAEDVTERTRREELVRRGERMAALGRTLAGVAHEINNPLAAITGFAQILLKRQQSPDDRHAVETMLHEARRAARIVKDLLTIARREEGGVRVPTDLHGIVRYIVETQRYAMETRGIVARVQLAAEDATVIADPAQLEQVILNLVVNARQALEGAARREAAAGEPRPTLTVSSRATAGRVVLEVSDNGPGIPAGDLPRIWDPFWTTRDEGEGSGLGLSVVHSIVVSHGGSIDVRSTPGAGTRFTIALPIAPARVSGEVPATEGRRGPRTTPSRPLDILVVDDERVIRELMSRYLASRGHAVVAAASGAQALRLAEQGSFDVVISDLRMPGMDGLALIRHLRALPSFAGTRFLLSTGDATLARADTGDDALAGVDIVNKPYDVEALIDLVEAR